MKIVKLKSKETPVENYHIFEFEDNMEMHIIGSFPETMIIFLSDGNKESKRFNSTNLNEILSKYKYVLAEMMI